MAFARRLFVSVLGLIVIISVQGTAHGWFRSGQKASILLSGIGFNNAGYLASPGDGLLFNHPMNIFTDGTRLLLTDTRNNRVLIWTSLPASNVSPDLVLGQPDFTSNAPGSDRSGMNWPAGVAAASGKVVVADSENNRVLIWNTFPATSGQAADLVLEMRDFENPKARIEWPWDVWTDGTKLIVTSTEASSTVLIWNTFPTADNQPADLYLKAKDPDDATDRFGTPRSIGTDGEDYLVIGDHNAVDQTHASGSFFWNTFPTTDNQPYDFFMGNPQDGNQMMWGGSETADGKFLMVASPGIAIWNSVPESADTFPDLFVGSRDGDCDGAGYYFNDGDGSDLTLTPSGRLYISLYNSNKIVAFNTVPASATQCPDFAIGSTDIQTNTLDTHYIITNPIPATDGEHLFVSSDFDRKLFVWQSMPTESGTHPDLVYDLEYAPWDNALHGGTLVLGGRQTLEIWTTLPLSGNSADFTFDGQLGSVVFQTIMGVALDDHYLYVADGGAGKVYVWEALPEADIPPLFSFDVPHAGRLSSDGSYLAVTTYSGPGDSVSIYQVDGLNASSKHLARIDDLPIAWPNACIGENQLFISSYNNNAVYGWRSIQDAIAGEGPALTLGQADVRPAIGRASLYYPVGLAFSDDTLWVGEFKFSGRLIGFRAGPDIVPALLPLLLND